MKKEKFIAPKNPPQEISTEDRLKNLAAELLRVGLSEQLTDQEKHKQKEDIIERVKILRNKEKNNNKN